MLGGDELDHVDAVAEHLERRGTQCVGDEVGLPAEQQPVPEQRILAAGRDLAGQLVVAARRDDDRVGAEPHSGGDRLVGRGVARVQRDEQVDRLVARVVDDRGRLEARLVVAELLCDSRTVSITAALLSSPTSSTRVPSSRPYATRARLMYALPQPASTTRMRSRSQSGSGRSSST